MEYTIDSTISRINWNASGVEEVLQNVKTIITTPIFSVPLRRNWFIDLSLLDNPMNVAQAKLRSHIYELIKVHEPRAVVKEIHFIQDNTDSMDGKSIIQIKLEVNLDGAS